MDPADYLQQLVADDEAKPVSRSTSSRTLGLVWRPLFHRMAAGGAAWDMVIGVIASRLGQSTTAGYYVDMTEFLNSLPVSRTRSPRPP